MLHLRALSEIVSPLRDSAAGTLFVIFPVVDAEDAFFADPPLALRGNEFADSVLSDKFQIFDLAHAVFCPVTFIEMLEPLAGEFRAVAAEAALALSADAQAAMLSGLVLLEVNAAEARVFRPQIGFADAAIHSAWGD